MTSDPGVEPKPSAKGLRKKVLQKSFQKDRSCKRALQIPGSVWALQKGLQEKYCSMWALQKGLQKCDSGLQKNVEGHLGNQHGQKQKSVTVRNVRRQPNLI